MRRRTKSIFQRFCRNFRFKFGWRAERWHFSFWELLQGRGHRFKSGGIIEKFFGYALCFSEELLLPPLTFLSILKKYLAPPWQKWVYFPPNPTVATLLFCLPTVKVAWIAIPAWTASSLASYRVVILLLPMAYLHSTVKGKPVVDFSFFVLRLKQFDESELREQPLFHSIKINYHMKGISFSPKDVFQRFGERYLNFFPRAIPSPIFEHINNERIVGLKILDQLAQICDMQ